MWGDILHLIWVRLVADAITLMIFAAPFLIVFGIRRIRAALRSGR